MGIVSRSVVIFVAGAGLHSLLGCAANQAPDEDGQAGSSASAGLSGSAGMSTGSSGAGTTSSGGSDAGSTSVGGSGSSAECNEKLSPGADVISDFESGKGDLENVSGRAGGWYAYNDGTATGMQTPAPSPSASAPPSLLPEERCGSTYAMHTSGSGFATWGAGLGTNLAAPYDAATMTSGKGSYDASGYRGIEFFAKVGGGGATALRVNFPTEDTDPFFKVCATGKCDDHFGKYIQLTTAWQKVTIDFADIRQQDFGQMFPKFRAEALVALQFQEKEGANFDLWIDDVAFTK